MIALVNDQLLAAGKPALGFLNPFLYANPSAFNDITIGHNSGFSCDEDTVRHLILWTYLCFTHSSSQVAFDAAEGWDPLSVSFLRLFCISQLIFLFFFFRWHGYPRLPAFARCRIDCMSTA
jgi:hypothetical protein